MHLARYIKSLGTSVKYYHDKLSTWQTIVTYVAGASLLYFSFDPFQTLKNYEAYKPTFFIVVAFIMLFMAGYRSWKEEFQKNTKEESIILKTDCSTSLSTTWKLQVKFGHIKVSFQFLLRNMKNHPVTIKKVQTDLFEQQVNFKQYYKPDLTSIGKIPLVIEPLGTSEITLSRDYDISHLEYIDQVAIIDSLKNIDSECVITFVSILGQNKTTVPVHIDSQQILIDNFRKRKDTGINGSPIKVALEKRGVELEW